MGYEEASKTKLVATHCVCCGRPLCDAESVETGVGPICARKYGYSKCDEDADFREALENAKQGDCAQVIWDAIESRNARVACNKIVYLLAAEPEHAKRIYRIEAIRALGFKKLGDRLEERLLDDVGEVSVEVEGQYLFVSTTNLHKAMFEALLAEFRNVPGRRWVPERRSNKFPVSSKFKVWGALRRAAAGCKVVVGENESVIPAIVKQAAVA